MFVFPDVLGLGWGCTRSERGSTRWRAMGSQISQAQSALRVNLNRGDLSLARPLPTDAQSIDVRHGSARVGAGSPVTRPKQNAIVPNEHPQA